MNARQTIWVLLLLNVGLLVAVVFLAMRGREQVAMEGFVAGEGQVVTNTVTQIAVRQINATNLLAALANRPLSWRMIESTNYFLYAQNLRNFGCPEETVRDIMITDIAKTYAERRHLLRAAAPPAPFCQTSESGAPGESAEVRTQIDELDREQ